jgi:hypothetical protein
MSLTEIICSLASAGGLMLLGWALLAGALPLFIFSGENEIAIAFWLGGAMIIAYALVATAISIRTRKKAVAASNLDPEARPTRWHRALARFLLAVPLAGLAASAASALFALRFGSLVNGLAFAAIAQPLLWGCAMAWALADPRLVRPAFGLGAVSALFLGAAFLLPSTL